MIQPPHTNTELLPTWYDPHILMYLAVLYIEKHNQELHVQVCFNIILNHFPQDNYSHQLLVHTQYGS